MGESSTSAAATADNWSTASPRWPGNDKPYRITMGMHPCNIADWLLRGARADALIAAKAPVLAHDHGQAVLVTEVGDAGAREAAAMVTAALAAAGADTAAQLAGLPADLHPLEAAARLTAEDLVIMSRASAQPDAEYVLTAAVLCSPSRWDLHEKAGRTMREIHEPVPNYDSIAAASDRFFTRLAAGDIIERTNWTVLDSPEGFQPAPGPGWDATLGGLADEDLLQHLWLRLERQTLRRLPSSGDVLFTILTTSTRLDELESLGAHVTRQLAGWVGTAGQDVHVYRGWGSQWPRVVQALEAACSSSGR